MRIGYCSPFNPMKSGISDFSEELIGALKKHVEIVVFSPVKPSKLQEETNVEIHMLSELDDSALRESLDIIVYHVGNNPTYHGEIVDMLQKYPGVVEIHEIGLHHLFADRFFVNQGKEKYLEAVRYCHGQRGVQIAEDFFAGKCGAPWNDHALDMCMARFVIEPAKAVIVHSETVKQMVLGMKQEVPIKKIMLHAEVDSPDYEALKLESRQKLGFKTKKIVFGSFGFVSEAKRIIPILNALTKLKKKTEDFTFLIVGENLTEIDFEREVQKRHLTDNVVITGFISLDEFRTYIGACDFCLNLRYPTQGETSGSVHRMLGMGKPIIMTDIGSFGDYPDEFALKVRYDANEVNDIYEALLVLIKDSDGLKRRKKKAYEYAVKYCDLDSNAHSYVEFFQQVTNGTWTKEQTDALIDTLVELEMTDEAYIAHLEDRWGDMIKIL